MACWLALEVRFGEDRQWDDPAGACALAYYWWMISGPLVDFHHPDWSILSNSTRRSDGGMG